MGCHFLLQEIFLSQGSNWHLLCLLHWQVESLPLCKLGSCSSSHIALYDWSYVFVFYQILRTLDSMCCAYLLSHVQHFATPWAVTHQALLSIVILQARILEWVSMPFSKGSSQPSLPHCRWIPYHLSHQGSFWDTKVSRILRLLPRFLYSSCTLNNPLILRVGRTCEYEEVVTPLIRLNYKMRW